VGLDIETSTMCATYLVEAGFSKRIMYGSDQMQWPQSIGPSIEAIELAPFLTRAEERYLL
jgi:hypothetical protein